MVSSRSTGGIVAVALLSLSICLPQAKGVPTVDLSTAGSSGSINGALFEQISPGAMGSGTIHSFVRIQGKSGAERGYNTNARPLEFDENNSRTFTRSLALSIVPVVDKGGTLYREFLLDINQSAGIPDGLLSLDTIEIYLAATEYRTDYPSLGTKIFDLDAGAADHWILLNYNLNGGSGAGDMLAYIPDALFTGGEYAYLYSQFGASEGGLYPHNAGFEEWAVREGEIPPPPPPPVPAPAAFLLALAGSGIVLSVHRHRKA